NKIHRVLPRVTLRIFGGALVLLGVVMIPLPGPGIPVVVAGLFVLSTEFAWAARARERASALSARARPTSA
ncbi:MAG: hypothetical protein JWN48_171, partial [Myxococcaceae bacterium]|nr:hypothetical protein [Myxococcaceae bacterium]